MAANLCPDCRQIDWHSVVVEERTCLLMHSIPSLKESATSEWVSGDGCPLCGLFYSSLSCSIDNDPDVPSFGPKEEGGDVESIKTTALCDDCMVRAHVGMLIVGSDRDSKVGVLVPCEIDETTGKANQYHYAKMTLSRDANSPKLSWKEDLRDVRNMRKGNEVLENGWIFPAELICGWIDHCLQKHEACYYPLEDPLLPTRVIDVGTAEHPTSKLVETRGAHGRWIALSYCWGPEDPIRPRLKTTMATLHEFYAHIPYELLPRLLQDAIMVTRGLGIRYIWIDSFTIIQDSLVDWEREASRMAMVYRDSFITIAASGASNPQDSLFLDRFEINSKPVQIEIRDTLDSLDSPRFIHRGRQSIRERLSRDPLQLRGWTLQETQLTIRALYYSENELFWQCREGVTRELWPTQYIIPADPLIPRRIFDSFVKWPVNIFARWCDLVEMFSKRSLSYKSDTLPAMSGLAAELALFLQSRSNRRLATEEESKKLLDPLPPPPGFPVNEPIGPSIYKGLNGVPVHDGANAATAAMLDQVEFARSSPLPGYEDMPLRLKIFKLKYYLKSLFRFPK